jgi:hypothetical protein
MSEIDRGNESEFEAAQKERTFDDAAHEQTRPPAFSRGQALSDGEGFAITSAAPTTVVVFAGAVASGKTTLLAALYERLGRGPLAGQLFGGSRTLPGFERRCHGGRRGSGHVHAQTPHTSLDALPWLHLRLRPVEGTGARHDLLLGDFNGEHFNRLISGNVTATEMPFLRRADHVCVTLDGASLADPVARPSHRQHAIDLVQALIRRDQMSQSVVSLVVTKWDRIRREGADAQIAVDDLTDELVALCAAAYPSADVPVALTAARSTIAELPLGHGLEELIGLWLTLPSWQLSHPPDLHEDQDRTPFGSFNA